VERLSNRIGYHFHLQRAAYPGRAGGPFAIELTVTNRGVAPVYIPCAVAFALLDDRDQRLATVWPDGIAPRQWQPGAAKSETVALDFGAVPAGSYRLACAITAKRDEPQPYIRLGTELPVVDGWYVLGRIALEATGRR
jgi:hypothetical protein